MYLIKRVWITKPREARRVATLVAEIGKIYEASGQRQPTRVYFNGGTLPGDRNIVYMEWTAEAIESPYREGNVLPDTGDLGARVRELTEDNWIEFYEMLTPANALPID
jgi:hypothetical protein